MDHSIKGFTVRKRIPANCGDRSGKGLSSSLRLARDDRHLVATGQKLPDQGLADKSGTTGNEDFHTLVLAFAIEARQPVLVLQFNR